MDLPTALPPIIKADVNAAISTDATAVGSPIAARYSAMTEPAEPLTTPTMSPTTSLSRLETRSALRISWSACFAPRMRLEAIAINGCSSADVTAVPMTSVITPMEISTINASSATSSPAESTNKLVKTDITTESAKERITTVSTHCRFSCFVFSLLLTGFHSIIILKKPTKTVGRIAKRKVVIQQIDLAA